MISARPGAFALATAGAMLLSVAAYGQTLTTIHDFHSKGQYPTAGVLNVGSHLFGTTQYGGASGYGSVYKIRLAGGNSETSFHDFTGGTVDGSQPIADLIKVGKTLYGTTDIGGAGVDPSGCGTAFTVGLDGSNFTVIHIFTDAPGDAQHVTGRLIYSDGVFYGAAQAAQNTNPGGIFKMDLSGNVTGLYYFTGGTDGATPYGGLVKIGSYLYGTTEQAGAPGQGYGTIFRVKTDGSHFQVLHTFAGAAGGDGDDSRTALVRFRGSLFGVTRVGGAAPGGYGTVFRIDPDGSNYSVVHSFASTADDGGLPIGGMVAVSSTAGSPADTLYGTTSSGGSNGVGTVFKIDSGGVVTTLYSFGAHGAVPQGQLINIADSDGGPHLYGTATDGGHWGYGTVFEFTP